MSKISLRLPVVLALALLTLPLAAGPAEAADPEEKAILAAVHAAYIVGGQTNSDTDAMREGFHEDFVMFILGDDGDIRHVTLEDWTGRIDESKAKNPDRPKPEVEGRLTLLDRTGKAAVVKVEVERDGEHVYTDYMSMYHFEDGWKIVAKTFQTHD